MEIGILGVLAVLAVVYCFVWIGEWINRRTSRHLYEFFDPDNKGD